MKKYKIVFSKDAKKDLENIFDYVRDISSEPNAKNVIAEIAKKVSSFTTFPERNESFAKGGDGSPLRVMVGGRYRIVYIVKRSEKMVVIARIVSVSQDYR